MAINRVILISKPSRKRDRPTETRSLILRKKLKRSRPSRRVTTKQPLVHADATAGAQGGAQSRVRHRIRINTIVIYLIS